ncbi:MAG: hypothetical protein KGJ21_09940 [Pseudomonadota bacterium]|nr:hypothetical protein [Pseudomonadota bacterium]
MTIVFQGHVKSVDMSTAPIGKLAVTIQMPMAEAGGKEITIFVPEDEGCLWQPSYSVSFTVYALAPQYLVDACNASRKSR